MSSSSTKTHRFHEEQGCPTCRARFTTAERQTQYDPVVVVVCPQCATMLWLPGLDGDCLYVFDPDADSGGI